MKLLQKRNSQRCTKGNNNNDHNKNNRDHNKDDDDDDESKKCDCLSMEGNCET